MIGPAAENRYPRNIRGPWRVLLPSGIGHRRGPATEDAAANGPGPIPNADVVAAARRERLDSRGQHRIAAGATEPAVDVPEAVQPEQDHPRWRRLPVRRRRRGRDPTQDQGAVGEPGRRVVRGPIGALGLKCLALGNIAAVDDDPGQARVTEQVGRHRFRLAVGTVRGAQANGRRTGASDHAGAGSPPRVRYDSPGAGGGERRVGSVATPAARAAMGGMTESPPAAGLIAASDQTAGVAPGVTVAPVRFGDLRGVARLQRRAFRPRLAYTLTTLVVLWLLPQVRFVVAREAGRLVGCAIGDRQDHHSRVVNIAVEPEARRRGVATALLRALEAALPEGNVLLMVEADNLAARALYEREGYARVGDARDYYGRGRDGVWMQKRRTTLATPKFWV